MPETESPKNSIHCFPTNICVGKSFSPYGVQKTTKDRIPTSYFNPFLTAALLQVTTHTISSTYSFTRLRCVQ